MQRRRRAGGCMVAAHECSLNESSNSVRPVVPPRWSWLRELREQRGDRRQRWIRPWHRRHGRHGRRWPHEGAVRPPRARDQRRRPAVWDGGQPDRPALGRLQGRRLLDVRRLPAVADRALRGAGGRRHPDDLLHQQRQQRGVGLRRHLDPGGRGRQRDRQPHRSSLPRRSDRLQLRHGRRHAHAGARRLHELHRPALCAADDGLDGGLAVRRHRLRQRRHVAVPGEPWRRRRDDRRGNQRQHGSLQPPHLPRADRRHGAELLEPD